LYFSNHRSHFIRDTGKKYPTNANFWRKWDNCRLRYASGEISTEARKFLNRLIAYHPDNRPTFAELVAAINGESTDDTLAWISSKDVCTVGELEHDLNRRLRAAPTDPHAVHFIDTKKLWRKFKVCVDVLLNLNIVKFDT